MTGKPPPPTDPIQRHNWDQIQRHNWDQDPGPEIPRWLAWSIAAAAIIGPLTFLGLGVWGLIELFAAIRRTP